MSHSGDLYVHYSVTYYGDNVYICEGEREKQEKRKFLFLYHCCVLRFYRIEHDTIESHVTLVVFANYST